jgi:hypothetical protein
MASRDTRSCPCRWRPPGKFGNRRNLAQQAERIEPPLLNGLSGPQQLDGPADLIFDF